MESKKDIASVECLLCGHQNIIMILDGQLQVDFLHRGTVIQSFDYMFADDINGLWANT